MVLSNIKNMIFYTWNIFTLYPVCIMSCISFMNVITKVNKENPSNALSCLVYILDTRVVIYYQYVYGPLMLMVHGGMITNKKWGHIFYYFLNVLAPHNIKLHNYVDQLISMSMCITNQNTLWWGHELWLWGHVFGWWGHEFYKRAI